MTSIINSNIHKLHRALIQKYGFILKSNTLKIQLKIIISIYMYWKKEATENPLFHANQDVLDIFNKYVRFIELDYFYFKNSLNENEEYLYVVGNKDKPNDEHSADKSFFSLLKRYKKKQIVESTAESVSGETAPLKINQDLEFIRSFMKPHVNYANPISNKIFDTMISTVRFDNEKTAMIKKSVMDEFALKMFSSTVANNISVFSLTTLTNETSYNSATKLKERIERLDEYTKNTTELSNLIFKVKNNSFGILKMVDQEKSNSYKKTYCKLTLLLNVEKLLKTLNADILTVIKSFVGDELIEKTRRLFIKQKHFSQPHVSIHQLLKKMTHHELTAFCRNNLCLSFNFAQFENGINDDIFNYEHLFLTEYEVCLCRSMYGTNLEFFKKKRIIKEIVSHPRIINNFEFQREVFLVSLILEQTRACRLDRLTKHCSHIVRGVN